MRYADGKLVSPNALTEMFGRFINKHGFKNIRVEELTCQLDTVVEKKLEGSTNQDVIERYLQVCTDEEYETLVDTAAEYLDRLAQQEQQKHYSDLQNQIRLAVEKQQTEFEQKLLYSLER